MLRAECLICCVCVAVQLQLVGLSVMDTARKLKEKQQDTLYHEFVEAMLPDRGKSGAAVRCSRVRFTIECEVLAKSRKFKALLDKAEAVRPHPFMRRCIHLPVHALGTRMCGVLVYPRHQRAPMCRCGCVFLSATLIRASSVSNTVTTCLA